MANTLRGRDIQWNNSLLPFPLLLSPQSEQAELIETCKLILQSPSEENVQSFLQNYFGFPCFRPGQLETILRTIKGFLNDFSYCYYYLFSPKIKGSGSVYMCPRIVNTVSIYICMYFTMTWLRSDYQDIQHY